MRKSPTKLLLLSGILLFFVSCSISYKFNGASLDYNKVKTISFSKFPIRASLVYAPLAPLFNDELQNIYIRQTRLNVVPTNGDLQVEGEITGYNLSPQAVGADGYASQTRLTIQVRVRYTNSKQPEFSIDRTFSAYRDFSSSVLLNQVQDELNVQIVNELVDLIFNATVANW